MLLVKEIRGPCCQLLQIWNSGQFILNLRQVVGEINFILLFYIVEHALVIADWDHFTCNVVPILKGAAECDLVHLNRDKLLYTRLSSYLDKAIGAEWVQVQAILNFTRLRDCCNSARGVFNVPIQLVTFFELYDSKLLALTGEKDWKVMLKCTKCGLA